MSQELDQMRVRREKMDELKAAGIEPFGRRYHRDTWLRICMNNLIR